MPHDDTRDDDTRDDDTARPSRPANITDPKAMRALAHPLRMAMLEVLAREEGITATRCAEILGESQANCSFHLRMLAKYGFVEEAPSTDRRERPWRLTSLEQSWSNVQPDVASAVAADQLSRVFVRREFDRALRWIGTRHDEPEEWQRAAYFSGLLVRMTVEELDRVRDGLTEVLEPYVRRVMEREDPPEGARPVRLVMTGFPITPGEME